jgi:hypothetical protein
MKSLQAIKIFAASLVFVSAAHAQEDQFNLDGKYAVELKIGDRTYLDQMELKGQDRPIQMTFFRGPIIGTMTVPGAFSSPISGEGYCSAWMASCQLDFDIEAHEQGQMYKVHYRAETQMDNYLNVSSQTTFPILTGTATLENGELLGTFVATKQ